MRIKKNATWNRRRLVDYKRRIFEVIPTPCQIVGETKVSYRIHVEYESREIIVRKHNVEKIDDNNQLKLEI